MKLKENSNFKEIRDELERRLNIMLYSNETIKAYFRIIDCLEEYLKEYGQTSYTKGFGQQFVSEYSLQQNNNLTQSRHVLTVIRRLDEMLENKQFTPCFHQLKFECPSRFRSLLEKYLENLVKCGYSNNTVKSRRGYIGRFFSCLPERVFSVEELTASDLYEVFTKSKWPSVGLSIMRYYLCFLYANKTIKTNLSACVPKPTRPSTLPSVYSGEEIQRLLSAVDRTTSLGKRDYAILILSAYMGLRSSDIVNLSFKNIDHITKTISIIQTKTARPAKYVMNKEVEESLIDYIQNGRPKSPSEKIFLGTQAPYSPLTAGNGYIIAHKYFNLAGIPKQGRRRGTHALRSSYATGLVAQGIPYAVVQKALGHEEPDSTKYYVRIDSKRLRMCALDVPKPIGAFAILLEPDVRKELEGVLS